MRRDGGRRTGEAETVFVASERRIMLSGSTERGPAARDVASAKVGGGSGMVSGWSTIVEGRRSEDEMWRREAGDVGRRPVFAGFHIVGRHDEVLPKDEL